MSDTQKLPASPTPIESETLRAEPTRTGIPRRCCGSGSRAPQQRQCRGNVSRNLFYRGGSCLQFVKTQHVWGAVQGRAIRRAVPAVNRKSPVLDMLLTFDH